MGFQQALSGLNAASRNLDVIGNNIANVNTVGSKSSRAEFQDMYAASISGGGSGFGGNVGIGVNPGVVAQQFTQGNITSTGNPLDLAINGGGFFQLSDGRNPAVYSRNGQLKVDTNGFIVNNSNLKLLGYQADYTGTIIPGIAAPIQLPTSGIAPAFTTAMSLEFNTDSRVGRPKGMLSNAAKPLVPGTSTPATISTTAVNNLNFSTTGVAATPAKSTTVALADAGLNWTASGAAANFSITDGTGGPYVITLGGSDYTTAGLGHAQLATDINAKLVLAGSTTTASINGSDQLVLTSGVTGLASVVPTISASGVDALAANVKAAGGTTLAGANSTTTNAAITVDGVPITLNQDAAGSVSTLAAQLTAKMQASALGANYSATVNAGGNLVITQAGSTAAVVISAADSVATTAGFGNTLGVAGTAATAAITADQDVINVSDPTTYNNATSATIHDVKGQPVTLTYYFQKVSADTWNVYATANGQPINGITGETAAAMHPVATINYPNTGSPPTTAGGGSINTYAWAANGLSKTTTAVTSGKITLPSIPSVKLVSGGYTEVIAPFTVDLRNITQFGGEFGVTSLAVDGNAPGALTGVGIGSDGVLTTRYSNGQTKIAGVIELATFRNAQGLQPMGGNVWSQSSVSGAPVYNTPGQGNLGVLQSGAVEESNVDLTSELVNMMTAQRAYQANAQTIKTQDQVMSTLVNMR